jgi:hypothetical protein
VGRGGGGRRVRREGGGRRARGQGDGRGLGLGLGSGAERPSALRLAVNLASLRRHLEQVKQRKLVSVVDNDLFPVLNRRGSFSDDELADGLEGLAEELAGGLDSAIVERDTSSSSSSSGGSDEGGDARAQLGPSGMQPGRPGTQAGPSGTRLDSSGTQPSPSSSYRDVALAAVNSGPGAGTEATRGSGPRSIAGVEAGAGAGRRGTSRITFLGFKLRTEAGIRAQAQAKAKAASIKGRLNRGRQTNGGQTKGKSKAKPKTAVIKGCQVNVSVVAMPTLSPLPEVSEEEASVRG